MLDSGKAIKITSYQVMENDEGRYCVYPMMGEQQEAAVKCFDTQAEAQAERDSMMADMEASAGELSSGMMSLKAVDSKITSYQIVPNEQGRYCICPMMGDEQGDALICYDTMDEAQAAMDLMMVAMGDMMAAMGQMLAGGGEVHDHDASTGTMSLRDISLNDLASQLWQALDAAGWQERPYLDLWVEEPFLITLDTGYAIADAGDVYYKVPFALVDGVLVISPREDWDVVASEWIVKHATEVATDVATVVAMVTRAATFVDRGAKTARIAIAVAEPPADPPVQLASAPPVQPASALASAPATRSTRVAIKSETDDTIVVVGWGVVFGGLDLCSTRFTKDTDYWLAQLGATKVALYDHGMNDAIKQTVIGSALITMAEDGLWVEAELEKHSKYVQQISKLIDAGVIGWSSGAIGHLIDGAEDEAGVYTYKSWPIAEMSLTPTPAEPRTLGVAQIRNLVEEVPALKDFLSRDASDEDASKRAISVRATQQVHVMSDPAYRITSEDKNDMGLDELQIQVTSLATKHDNISSMLERVLKHFEDEPALKNVGFVSQDGGVADPKSRNFADFLTAIRRHDVKRLEALYGSVRTMEEGSGVTGGYTVPLDMRTDLLQATLNASQLLPLVKVIPVTTDAGSWPALDQYITPTAGVGQTAFAAGVTATTTAESGTLPTTEPAFKEINWKVTKIGGVAYISNELASDSPIAMDILLRGLFGIAVAAKREYYILRGTGAGEPLGVLNAPCAVAVATATNDAFAWVDALAMIARFKQVTQNIRWVAHPGVLPDLGAAAWVTGNVARRIEDLGFGSLVMSEHMPQANGDDVILGDWGTYLLFERQSLAIAFSEHAAFESDRGVWRFTERLDGQPWVKGPIVLADPTGSYTVSPFVYHDD